MKNKAWFVALIKHFKVILYPFLDHYWHHESSCQSLIKAPRYRDLAIVVRIMTTTINSTVPSWKLEGPWAVHLTLGQNWEMGQLCCWLSSVSARQCSMSALIRIPPGTIFSNIFFIISDAASNLFLFRIQVVYLLHTEQNKLKFIGCLGALLLAGNIIFYMGMQNWSKQPERILIHTLELKAWRFEIFHIMFA